jgi:hypothetical protein
MSAPHGSRGELELGVWRAGDPPALEAFEPQPLERGGPFRPRSAAHWDWAFRRNPAGVRLHLARRGGRVVGRYGALPVRARVMGETRTFANLIDSAVWPGETEGEVLLPLAQALLAAHGGPDGDLVHYGWPVERDLAFGKQHLEHELLRVTCLLSREPGPGPRVPPDGVEELARFGPEADELYSCCATHWHASAIRDAAFLNWRFVEHPARRFRLLGFRGGSVLRGYAAYHFGPELLFGPALLMDWLVLPGDEEASERLLAAVLACARADGAPALAAAFPEWSPWSLYFQERGFLHGPSEYLEVVRSTVPRFDMLWLRDNWWTTLADALIL